MDNIIFRLILISLLSTLLSLNRYTYYYYLCVDTHAPSSTTHVIDISDDNDDDDGNYSNFLQ